MSETENTSSTDNNSKKPVDSSGSGGGVITNPFSTPGSRFVEFGDSNPRQISITPGGEEKDNSTLVRNFVRRDNVSPEVRQKEYELRREATIDEIKERLRSNRPGAEIIAEFENELSGEAISQLVREAKNRLESERTEQQSIIEDRQAEFHRRLQERRFVCEYCGAVCGWTDDSERNHLKICVPYHEHKKAEDQKFQRRRNFVDRCERLLDFDIPRSIGYVTEVVDKINSIKWEENEAKYTSRDQAIIEATQRIREKISSESDYERRRRQKQIADLRYAAGAIESFYRRLDEPEEN
jgi:hypothetical protein